MSLYFVFTIDGDWDEYFNINLSLKERGPTKDGMITLIKREIRLAERTIGGRFIHFVHTSPFVRDFFLQPEFIQLWKEMREKGGSVGVHCHEEELYKVWHFDDPKRMEKAIASLARGLRQEGVPTIAYRGGFLAFSRKTIPILEENKLLLDFSCEPGRKLFHEDILIADWENAPKNIYRMSYKNKKKPGKSKVVEVPLGIYIEKQSLWQIWQSAKKLKQNKGIWVVSVLAHSYDYSSWKIRLKIKIALLILKRYGKFINAMEALDIVKSSGVNEG